MASSRLKDDTCAYTRALKQSTDPLSYQLEPSKYINSRRCRHQLGLVGGNNVSTLTGEALVDTESELFNITRQASMCPSKQYVPGRDYAHTLDDKTHLQACQTINYKAVPGAVWTPPNM
jgi:hypothetical protein